MTYTPIETENWYIKVKWFNYPMNDFNKWAIEMLKLISKNEWWEESETYYLEKYFNKN